MRSLTAILLLAGCGLYNHDDVECRAVPAVHGEPLRDPFTGRCSLASSCGPCEPCPLGPPSESTVGASACGTSCEALSEAACLDTKSCRAAYRTDAQGAAFAGCWATAAGKPPSSAADCTQLDVRSCAFHDDCSPFYAGASTDAMSFHHCEVEREGCGPATCGAPPPCPSNSLPSTRNGCYTGHCIARSQCPQA